MTSVPEIRFFRDRQGHRVAYAAHGDGPLVICPAWWVSNAERDWTHPGFRRFFERVGDGFRLVRYDRPGVGLSDRDVPARTMGEEADLLDDIARLFDEPRYCLFAMSSAGPLALRHAARHPRRVGRVCLYGSYISGSEICEPEVQEAILMAIEAHWGMGSRALADIFLPEAPRPVLDASARQAREAASPQVARDLMRLTYQMDASAEVERVRAECLVLHRLDDRAIPFDAGRKLASRLPGARFVSLHGSAHPPWVDGDDISTMVNRFFRGVASDPAGPPGDDAGCMLDEANRCLRIEGRDVALTPLEFGVMQALVRSPGRIVTRSELLESVWKQSVEGSNRIDVIISGLRRKLGEWSASIETLTGHGYRFTGWRRVGKETGG